jgi:hypothetical protein
MKKQLLNIIVVASVLVVASLEFRARGEPTTQPTTSAFRQPPGLPEFDPDLPPGNGRNVVTIRCAVCHTPHYILNQPPFTKQVWTNEITKMRTAYGAPITADEEPKILEYLLAVRGKSEK